MNNNNQNNLPFIHKDTKNIISKGKVLLIIEKNKFLIEYKKERYICILNAKNEIYACYNLWS
tara:strand:+ start:184 stop:369 length:186 start_codon:yes stop_codon:yes gene_type:complete